MSSLKGKTIFMTGGSRGIGHAIALRAAQDGANIAIAAKTVEPHPHLPGTIFTAAQDFEDAGGRGLPIQTDIRDVDAIQSAVAKTVETFGGIDIVVNNASAISLTGTAHTSPKRYDLMHQVNIRGTFFTCQAALPHLKKADNPHILTLSPPLTMKAKWFKNHCAYTMSKFGMSMTVLGMAAEFGDMGIAVNALWPRTTIATAAIEFALGGEAMMKASRTPAIMGDAAHWMLTQNSRELTGQFLIDEDLLRAAGQTDFDHYRVDPNTPLQEDFFLPD